MAKGWNKGLKKTDHIGILKQSIALTGRRKVNYTVAICKQCKNSFEFQPHLKRQFCCKECQGGYYKGSNNPNKSKNKKISYCLKCGKLIKKYNVKYCGEYCRYYKYKISWIEKEFLNILTKNNIDFIFQKQINKFRFDFFIPGCNLFVETHGDYWHNNPLHKKGKKECIRHIIPDQEKKKFILNSEYRLLIIWENAFEDKIDIYSELFRFVVSNEKMGEINGKNKNR